MNGIVMRRRIFNIDFMGKSFKVLLVEKIEYRSSNPRSDKQGVHKRRQYQVFQEGRTFTQ